MATAVVQSGSGSTASLAELLMDLTNSLSCDPPLGCGRSGLSHSHFSPHEQQEQQQQQEEQKPQRTRRKRRRDVLDVFFDARGVFSSPPSPAAVRAHTRHLLGCARAHIASVSPTHAAVLDLLCGALFPAAADASAGRGGLTEAELMLHVILRTSVAAAPAWERPPVAARCWLSARATALVERSPALQRRMRWSCDPDPIVHAALRADGAAYGCGDVAGAAWRAAAAGSLRGAAPRGVWEGAGESEETRRIFARGAKRRSGTAGASEERRSRSGEREEEEEEEGEEGGGNEKEAQETERSGTVPNTLFRSVYPSAEPHCAMLFVALHCSVVGQRDPFHFLRLSNSDAEDCADGLHYPHDPSGAGAAPLLRLSSEFLTAHSRDAPCVRGVFSILRWGCTHGTLFLRLQRLCAHSLRPSWRASLGQYGRCALDALRRLVTLLQRAVAQSQARRGGPHGVSFVELMRAQHALRDVACDTLALADAFGVTACRDWDATVALARLSSATLLSSLHEQFTRRVTHAPTRKPRADVIGALLLATLCPLHRMLDAWLGAGTLDDPFDEFFIVPSHGTTPSGFCIDAAPQRLPTFFPRAAAEAVLHAGVSLRALRTAARTVSDCAARDARHAAFVSDDVDAAHGDGGGVAERLRLFIAALLGRAPHTNTPHAASAPVVDLCAAAGSVAYRSAFYEATNALLVAAPAPSGTQCPRPSAQSSLVSRQSRATSAWNEAVASEALRDDAVAAAEGARAKCREELRAVYVRRVGRHEAKRRMQQWRTERFALCVARARAMARAVGDLHEMCDAAAATGEPIVRPLQENPMRKHTNTHRRNSENSCASLGTHGAGAVVQSAPGRHRSSVCGSASGAGHSLASLFTVTSRRASHTGSVWKTPLLSVVALQATAVAFAHPPEMYVVADINDDEYMAQRTGPSTRDTATQDAIREALEEEDARVRGVDVAGEAYQRECVAIATRTLRRRHSRRRFHPLAPATNVESAAGETLEDSDEDGAVIADVWWTDPTVDEAPVPFCVSDGGDAAEAYGALALSEAEVQSILHCPSYYLALGHRAAHYLTHKALQVMLLGPYGTLFRLVQQLTGVCLLQSGRAAERIVGLWQRLTMTVLEENHFCASSVFAALNAAFVEEWESFVLYGQETVRVQLALLPAESNDDDNDDDDGVVVEDEEIAGSDTVCCEKSSGGRLLQDTAFRRRRRPCDERSAEKKDEECIAEDEEAKEGNAQRGTGEKETAPSLPESPFDFISRLTIQHSEPCEEFWVMPSHAMETYGDIFSTLLFWTSVTQLVTRVWRLGMKSGLSEAFFFFSVARSVLHAVSHHMWFLLAGHVAAYHRSLRVATSGLCAHSALERFTAGHAEFLSECRFAALLAPCFARARRQLYGIVRQVEEVEQCLLRSRAEDAQPPQQQPQPPPPPRTRRAHRGREPTRSAPSTPVKPRTQAKESPQQARRRQTRDTVRRRLQSLAGLTEIFVGHLTAVRDGVGGDAADAWGAAGDEEREVSAARREAARNAARGTALTALIRTLEMTMVAVKDKL